MSGGPAAEPTANAEVIVIGAGASGLKAARDLMDAGRSVIVLEAKDRVGGRTKAAELAGRTIDLGGQWVGARHTMLRAEAQRLGVTTYAQNTQGKSLMQLLGNLSAFVGDTPKMNPISLLEVARLQARWERDMRTLPPDAPWTAARAEQWDAQTVESWIARNVHTATARAFARFVPRGAWAAEASQVSYLWFLDALQSSGGLGHLLGIRGGGQEDKFVGGMHQIPRRLAEELGDRVILGAPAERVIQTDDGVVVETPKGAFAGRFAIIAAPPGPSARIRFDPTLPTRRDGLHQRMPMGAIIKAVIAYERPFWREAGFAGQIVTDDDVVGVLMDDVAPTGAPMLIAFIEGRRALELTGAGESARRGAIVASLVRFFGPAAAEPIAYADNDWTQEPFTHGYVGTMGPGALTRYGPALREPCGRVHWAGSETSVEWACSVEGALRAGARAAAEVVARHNT